MPDKSEITFGIGTASRMTGVSQKKLRSWEGKFIPEPERIVCGNRAYRRYTHEQIDLISRIKEYQDAGFTLSAAAQKAREEISKTGGVENEKS